MLNRSDHSNVITSLDIGKGDRAGRKSRVLRRIPDGTNGCAIWQEFETFRNKKSFTTTEENDMTTSKPGRKSAAELGVKISALSVQRPKPPAELSDAEKKTWKDVTATKPADWWRADTYPLLISYCRHVANATRLDDLIETFNYKDIKESFSLFDCLDKLLRARDRESRAMVNLARSMRISQQAMILPRGAGRATANSPMHDPEKPWELPHLS